MMNRTELYDAAELGAVDDRSVRVWVRAPGQASILVRLEVDGARPISVALPLSPDDDWIGVAELSLPAPVPNAPFVCTVGARRLVGRLAPTPTAHARLAFGFGSCNQLLVQDEERLWATSAAGIFPQMIQKLREADARFVLLIGDQIYSEVPQALSVRRREGFRAERGVAAELLDRYRAVYRAVFGHPDVRALREAFPTYCMWDDHELLGDWGSRYEVNRQSRPFFEAACRAFCEYEHLRNPGGGVGEPPYHFQLRYGDVGVLALDSRGERSHRRGRILGPTQWAALDRMLASDLTPPISTLFVVLTVPIAHVSTWFVRVAEQFSTSTGHAARDRWNSGAFRHERNELLRRLFAWQQGAPERQVILLSGDVHAANAYTIRPRHGPGVIRQFTSSPLTTPIPRSVRWLTRVVVRAPNLFEPELRFERHFSAVRHNFGIVQVEPLPPGGHRVEFTVHPGPMARVAFKPGD
jgi:phosphodiesterase/alkaline phosphatase D-like protein